MAYYVQRYGRGYSELLLFKQPIPERLSASVRLWRTLHGLEFHILENVTLYVSGKKPGVFHTKADGLAHVLIKNPDDDSFWNFQIVSTNSLELLEEALTAETVTRITEHISQNAPIADFNEFRETHARLEAERQAKVTEKAWENALEEQRRKEEADCKHAEAMKVAAIEFQKGDDINGDAFSDLLKFHGLWSKAHPQTKHFIQERLVSINNDGDYRYRSAPKTWRGKRSFGSGKVAGLARELHTLLEQAPADNGSGDVFTATQPLAA